MNQRIGTLDGLRFIAALGVLWIHTWTIHGNPRFYLWKIDIASFMAIGVNGVELFFVISGFCMYYFYANKNRYTYSDFCRFLLKRWLRLSPAFYAATIIYLLVNKFIYHWPVNFLYGFLHSLFYLNYLLGQYGTASHFWTLTAEWQFYMIIPFILIYQQKLGFKKMFTITFGVLFFAAIILILLMKSKSDDLGATIIFRGMEFGFGILAARLLLKTDVFFKRRKLWFCLFILITYTGRILVSAPVLALSVNYYNLFKLAGFTLMGAGFGGLLYLSVTSKQTLCHVLGSRFATKMGRVSYSFYLLHPLVYPFVAKFIIGSAPFLKGIAAPLASTLISAFILYPLALVSYTLLEKPTLSARIPSVK